MNVAGRDYLALGAHFALAFNLPGWLVSAIIQQESGADPWAMRFEPAFLARYVPPKPRVYGAVSADTERIGLATSWGLMQIMGLVARERGFTGPFLSALCNPDTGIEYGCRHLALLRDRYLDGSSWEPVIAAYNAGSPRRTEDGKWVNAAYVSGVLTLGGMRT